MSTTIMKLSSYFLFLICLMLFSALNQAVKRKRVCYFVVGDPNVELIEPNRMKWSLCTHVIYSFVAVDNGILKPGQRFTDYFLRMNTTKPNNVRALFSVGGTFGFARNQTLVETFINSTIDLCSKYNLDGIDIDWEFPNYSDDKQTFSNLLVSIRKRFDLELFNNGKELLLSAALTPILYIVDQSYDIPLITKTVDFVNLMTYDYHTPNTLIYTNFNSPLYPTKYDLWYFKYFNVQSSVQIMLNKGLLREKIMIGMPFYGYLYILANPKYHSVYSLTNGTQYQLRYDEICLLTKKQPFTNSSGVERIFDIEAKVPYLYSGYKWITFDDVESITIKSQYVIDTKLGGAMTFALNYDDIHDSCGMGAFALQQTIADIVS